MSLGGFGRRRDDGLGETLVLDHPFGQGDTAEGALAGLVFAPGMAGQIAADDHLDLERLTADTDGHHRIGHGNLPVGKDVCGQIEELGGDLVQDLALERDAFGQDDVEGGNTVCSHHDEEILSDAVDVPDLSGVLGYLTRKMKICVYNCFHISDWY